MSHYKINLKDISKIDKNTNIVIVRSEFNEEYSKELEDINIDYLNSLWFNNVKPYIVPWAFEIPWFLSKLLKIKKNKNTAFILLWVVIRWETSHYDFVAWESARKIMDLTCKYDNPIIFWILTCENEEQVKERINNSSSVSLLNLLSEFYKINN